MMADVRGRVCAFCGASGVTREHVWPKWLRKLTKNSGGRYRFGLSGVPSTLRDFEAPSFSHTIRRVCRTCNTGWMSELETATEILMTSMFAGECPVLGGAEQDTLSRWMYKTALVVALLNDETDATRVDPAHYRGVANGAMPANTTIWLGNMKGGELEAGSWLQRIEWDDRLEPGRGGDGYLFIVAVLSVVAIGTVMGGTGDIPPPFKMGPLSLESFQRIWPTSNNYATVWEKTRPLALDDLQEIASAWRQGGGAAPSTLTPG